MAQSAVFRSSELRCPVSAGGILVPRERRMDSVEEAAKILKIVVMSGGVPDIITHNVGRGKSDQAPNFRKQQLRKGCPSYPITYMILLEQVFKHCGLLKALEVLDDLAVAGYYPNIVACYLLFSDSNSSPTLITYNIVIDGQAKKGFMETAMEIFRFMVKC
ncbi:hypothetical protein Cgig2_000129 [Carnegiea gigantea]|uniref:Pentatricopeptide repeat-containing protein n=1 Tax=Carnegiea gigantea TaxID=171969 RepID=A0A9Q1KZ45_9CARY|nr:hypothetical protein Cgig2_000129 [Carnegiea gigantea]